jgi:hypothetical protein
LAYELGSDLALQQAVALRWIEIPNATANDAPPPRDQDCRGSLL